MKALEGNQKLQCQKSQQSPCTENLMIPEEPLNASVVFVGIVLTPTDLYELLRPFIVSTSLVMVQ